MSTIQLYKGVPDLRTTYFDRWLQNWYKNFKPSDESIEEAVKNVRVRLTEKGVIAVKNENQSNKIK